MHRTGAGGRHANYRRAKSFFCCLLYLGNKGVAYWRSCRRFAMDEPHLNIAEAMFFYMSFEPFKLLFWHHVRHKSKVELDYCLGRQHSLGAFADVARVKP